ncbi:MAG: putative lipid II flippase FtsW [Candidatus Viridilinea halotolerans]|uniref:Probable peptidoglycan glycosyltransferase FtsW n=1 Tax=Candidatus Viridilinea halotolerans TaxID=2491704 RepID=A0A426U5Z3_9CHLR|nr:MAG: putative lipid II flippase FtsW [Candidatus Viridilinea halotolerans]
MVVEKTHKPDYVLSATVGALVAFGLVMIYSASFVEGYNLHNNQYYYLLRQMVGATIGTIGLLVAQRIDYRLWRTYSVHLMIGCLALLVLVLILPASMTEVNNARSWIRLGEGGVFGLFSIQPAELAKLIMVIYFADWLSRRSEKVGNVSYGLIPFAVMLGLVCGLVMLQPDLGTTVVLVMIGGAIYFAAGARVWHVAGALGLAALAFWFLVSVVGWRNARILAFQDPEKYYNTFGFQPTHALYALGSGGFFGQGLGQARQKFQWLPQAHTDTIYAIIGEELGLLGTFAVLVAFALIAYRGYRIAGRAPNPFAALVAVGITSWLVLQALLNLGVTTSLVPFTGLTLPFISYGSTSLYTSMVAMGVLLNISKHTAQYQPEEMSDGPRTKRRPKLAFLDHLAVWRRHGRARLPSFGRSRRLRRR